jgi:hypothetical protein
LWDFYDASKPGFSYAHLTSMPFPNQGDTIDSQGEMVLRMNTLFTFALSQIAAAALK